MPISLNLDLYFSDSYPHTIAVAVSGGADSMALAVLTKQWADIKNAEMQNIEIITLIVNHNIRAQSTAEADGVADSLLSLGIKSHILTNQIKITPQNLQDQARKIRYDLLEAWCVDNDIVDLCIGHHLDDCLETVAIRKNMGSGLYGLAAMSPIRIRPFGRIIRPCLELEKQSLLKYCHEKKIPYVDDPSNYNIAFERVQNREKLSKDLVFKGEIVALRNKAIAFRKYMDKVILDALGEHTEFNEMGFVCLRDSFNTLEKDVQFYTMRHILLWVSGAMYAPRTEKLKTVVENIVEGDSFTVNGCQGKILQGKYYIFREIERAPDAVPSDIVYDNRFASNCTDMGCKLGLLGKNSTEILKSIDVDVKSLGVPKTILHTVPVLFKGMEILSLKGITFKNQTEHVIFLQNKYLIIYSAF